MTTRLSTMLALSLVLTLVGCNQQNFQYDARYQLTEVDGVLYRLNQKTGQVDRLEQDRFVPMKEPLPDTMADAVQGQAEQESDGE